MGPRRSWCRSDLIIERRESKPVLILCVRVADGGIGLLKLRLAQLDDRAEAQLKRVWASWRARFP